MNVAQLIEKLKAMPQDAEVSLAVYGYIAEGEPIDVSNFEKGEVLLEVER